MNLRAMNYLLLSIIGIITLFCFPLFYILEYFARINSFWYLSFLLLFLSVFIAVIPMLNANMRAREEIFIFFGVSTGLAITSYFAIVTERVISQFLVPYIPELLIVLGMSFLFIFATLNVFVDNMTKWV